MKIADASAVAIAAINQLYGSGILPVGDGSDPAKQNITSLDTATVVDLGKVVTNNNSIGENFLAHLIDQCGKIVFKTRDYVPELPSLWVDAIDWGGFVETCHVGLSDIMTDEMWNEGGFINYSNTTIDPVTLQPVGPQYAQHIAEVEHGYYAPRKHAKIFNESSSLMVPLSTGREQYASAFKGEEQLTQFISQLYQSVRNTIKAKAEVYALMLLQTAIAITSDHLETGGVSRDHVVHLCTEFNIIAGIDYTNNQRGALLDPVFMAYALKRIAEVRDNMTRFSTAFNNGKDVTFTPKEDNKLILLSTFARSAKFGVRANTYHEELLGVGDYETLTAWSAINDSGYQPFDYATASKIQIAEASAIKFRLNKNGAAWDTGDGQYVGGNIIGFVYDRYALGVSLIQEMTTSKYIASNNVWNSFTHNHINQIIDDDFNMCVFKLD